MLRDLRREFADKRPSAMRTTIWGPLEGANVRQRTDFLVPSCCNREQRDCEMPREVQESRRSYIVRHAERLAETGDFATCHAIEVALRRQGFIEAFEVLERSGQRKRLSWLCTPLRE